MHRRIRICLGICLLFVCAASANAVVPSPSFTLTASNVSMSDQGSGTSTFTLTSVNGFTGQVGVLCTGPSSLLVDLVLPSCDSPTQQVVVPANGSVSGSMSFVPPFSNQSLGRRGRPGKAPLEAPLVASALAMGLIGLRFRRRLSRWMVLLVIGAAGLAATAGVTGCIGHGGLAMTPGTYSYTLSAAARSSSATGNTTISVTVHGG
jgi:hypothetical protein